MCGIVGIFGRPGFKARGVFEDMLQLDVLRGPHSTGVAAFGEKRSFLLKGLMLPQDLLASPKYERNVEKQQLEINAYLGHNRFATEGRVIKRNAHPFTHKHITLMHNGTLTTKLNTDNRDFDTDSEGIAWAVANRSIDWVWKELSGAAALVWWDAKESSVNIITNGQRPIHIVPAIDNEQILWASESWMMAVAAGRNKFRIGDVITPKPNFLFTFKYDSVKRKIEHTSRELTPKYRGVGSSQGTFRQHQGAANHIGNRVYNPTTQRWEDKHENKPADGDESTAARSSKSNDNKDPLGPPWTDHPEYNQHRQHGSVVDSRGAKTAPVALNSGRNNGVAGSDAKVTTVEINPYKDKFNYNTMEYEKTDDQRVIEDLSKKIEGAKNKRSTLMLPRVLEHNVDDPDLVELRKKKLSEAQFLENYIECVYCDESLAAEYETAICLDEKNAVCSKCTEGGLKEGLSIHDIMRANK